MWKTIQTEPNYEVNSKGDVRNKKTNHVKSIRLDRYGYKRVTLYPSGKTYFIHRLVAEAFIPNPLNKPMINHIDNDAENNHVANLEWVTHSENMLHAQSQGRLFHAQSKAGKIAGARSTAKLQKLAQDCVGLLFNSWQVIDPNLTYRASKAYILCKCVCGKQTQIDFARLRRLDATSCKSCAKK